MKERIHMISEHRLSENNFTVSGRIKSMIPIWVIYLLIVIPTRFEGVQTAMYNFADAVTVPWVTSMVDFIINAFPYVLIILAISSVYEFFRRPKLDTIRIYEDKIGFVLEGNERTIGYDEIQCSYGKFQQSFYLGCKALDLPEEQYYFNAFNDRDILESELLKRANLH